MTAIFFDGAEVPSHRLLLIGAGVSRIGISYYRLVKRGLPKTKPYILAERLPADIEVVVDSGWRQAEAELSRSELEEYAVGWETFLAQNIERVTWVTELHAKGVMGMDWVMHQRAAFGEEFGTRILPVWQADDGHLALDRLAEKYESIAITGSSIDDDVTLASRVNSLEARFDTAVQGLAVAKPDNLRSIDFETVSTLAWVSPMRRGETIVWDGTRLVRYPKRMKEQARPRYKAIAEKAGLDVSKILADDPNEVTRLAIWSYLQLEANMTRSSGRLFSDNRDESDDPGSAENTSLPVGNSELEVRNEQPVEIQPRSAAEVRPLPIMGFDYKTVVEQDENGNDVLRDVPVVRSQQQSLRQCDTCFVAQNCPARKPQSACAFNLPIEVKTKEQLKSLLNAILEMQGQRVAFARFTEEINGGYPDPNTSQEIDRLFKLVKTIKELEDNREFARITVERQSSGGVLSALFGDRAQALRDLPQPIDEQQTTRIIQQSIE